MSDKRSIVFVNQATGFLTIDIINEFVRSGKFDKIALITGSIRVQDIPLSESVHWSKINIYDRGEPRKKLISWVVATLRIFFLLLIRYHRYEIFYITIPPFAYLNSLILRNRFSILVFDVYPDVLQIFGIRKSNLLFRIWAVFNKNLFKRAYRLYTLGEGMANQLEAYVEKSKIQVIHNWTGLTSVSEIEKDENILLNKLRLRGKFIVQYSGNIGMTHNVEIIIDLAKKMSNYDDIHFQIIGRGERYRTIEQYIKDCDLLNCSILPFQPDEILNHSLSMADIGIVLLDERTAHASLPSKIYNLQAVGIPILAIANPKSELAYHLARYENGACFSAQDDHQIVDYILRIKEDSNMLDLLKQKSKLASNDFTIKNALQYVNSYVQDRD